MFSNGTEYMAFLETNCFRCPFYVDPEEVNDENPACFIEERIALASYSGQEDFPYEWLDDNDSISIYTCRRRLGKKKKIRTVDKIPKYTKQKFTEDNLKKLGDLLTYKD